MTHRLLIVEDERDIADLIKHALERSGEIKADIVGTGAAALTAVNNSKYGLQAGVFTRDIGRVQQAWDDLDVGGVLINEIPAWRAVSSREISRWRLARMKSSALPTNNGGVKSSCRSMVDITCSRVLRNHAARSSSSLSSASSVRKR